VNDSSAAVTNTSGERRIQVTARDETSLLAEVLGQVFHSTDDMPGESRAQSTSAPEGEIIGFRATAIDAATLLGATVTAALDEADSQNVSVLGVEIGGMMPTSEGVRCWGYLTTTPRTSSLATAFIVSSSRLVVNGDRLHAEVVITIEAA